TTPESLYLMLTSGAREVLKSVEYVVVDEIHAVAGTKRGAHLALSLERLERLTDKPPQRIGLSATQRPLDEIARFLGGRGREELVRAHHGSVAREQRLEIEDALKAGKVPALVATSSLELGIDMGAVDLVVQVESPASVASGLQRIGRAGHQVGEPSRGRIFPK